MTFSAEKAEIAYTTENEPKFARKVERSFKATFHKVVEANQEYRVILDQDTILSPQEQWDRQKQLIDSILAAMQEYTELKLIRVELAGSWPVFQTEEGQLDLADEAD